MLLESTLYFGLLTVLSTLAALIPGAPRARFWLAVPGGAVLIALPELVIGLPELAVVAIAATLLVKAWQPRWGWIAAELYAAVLLGALSYLAYAGGLTFATGLGPVAMLASACLLLLELVALGLSASYLFEMLDLLGRRAGPRADPPRGHLPPIAIQVPAYNEPIEVVRPTLESLAKIDYPRLLVQVVDNNTPDREVWGALEQVCRELGDRFQFIHLENWPGYKAGALNEATRRLPADIDVVGIVDADYRVEPDWLQRTAGHFADPEVAFVQSPQDYRDWQDDSYLRGLYHSYRYFFDVTMPCRDHRNAIIFAGTMGLLRVSALREIGGWNADCVTEDAEASLRLLRAGYRGVYVQRPFGRGLMPLDFDGLKKQRFRWALGGVQLLKLHGRSLLRGGGRLTLAQRIHYLLGSVQWFGEVLMALFTLLLLATALATAMHHQLPLRRLTASATAIPLAFLFTGVLRAVWAIQATSRASWRDSINALRVWFALSWIVTLACIQGLVKSKTAFLRTPKFKSGQAKVLRALWASRTETLLAAGGTVGAVAMVVSAPSFPVAAVAVLLLFQSFIYSNAPWASLSAEGIKMTPLRQAFMRSSQSKGEWPERAERLLVLPAAVALFALVILGLTALKAPTSVPQAQNPNPFVQPPSGGSASSPSPAQTAPPAGGGGESPQPAFSPAQSSPAAPASSPASSP